MPLVRSFTSSPVRQYAFIDGRSRFRYPEAFEEHGAFSSGVFLYYVVEKLPYAIACIQTDTGSEFTNRRNASKAGRPARSLRRRFPGSVSGASLSDPYTPRRSGKAERSHRKDNEGFYASRKFCSFDAFAAQLALRQRYYSNIPPAPPQPARP